MTTYGFSESGITTRNVLINGRPMVKVIDKGLDMESFYACKDILVIDSCAITLVLNRFINSNISKLLMR